MSSFSLLSAAGMVKPHPCVARMSTLSNILQSSPHATHVQGGQDLGLHGLSVVEVGVDNFCDLLWERLQAVGQN